MSAADTRLAIQRALRATLDRVADDLDRQAYGYGGPTLSALRVTADALRSATRRRTKEKP